MFEFRQHVNRAGYCFVYCDRDTDLVELDTPGPEWFDISLYHDNSNFGSCDPKKCEMSDSIHCILIFIHVDENGSPIGVPSWDPKRKEDISLELYAKRLMELRRDLHKELGPLKFE